MKNLRGQCALMGAGVFALLFFSSFAGGAAQAHAETHSLYLVGVVAPVVFVGEEVKVAWLAVPPAEEGDWVGIFAVGGSTPFAWRSLAKGRTYGFLTFKIDRVGRYEVRFYAKGGNVMVVEKKSVYVVEDEGPDSFALSYAVRVEEREVSQGGLLPLSLRVPFDRVDERHWVGFYRDKDDEYDEYAFYQYVTPEKARSTVYVRAPSQEGSYWLRLFYGYGYQKVAEARRSVRVSRSAPHPALEGFSVSFEKARVKAGEPFRVLWRAPARRATSRDWVGIYKKGAGDRSYLTWQYIPDRGESGALTFTLPRAGEYEARLYLDNGYERAATAPTVLTVEE